MFASHFVLLSDRMLTPRVSSPQRWALIVAGPLLLTVIPGCSGRQETAPPIGPAAERYAIVPAPRRLEARPGEFRLDRATRVVLSDPASAELRALAELLAAPLREASGLALPVSSEPAGDDAPNVIAIRLAPSASGGEQESYRLAVTERGATLSAATPAEWFARTEAAAR